MNHKEIAEFNRLMGIPEISKQVYDRHPISKSERKCPQEKSDMERLRLALAKKIYGQVPVKEKVEFK